MLFEQEHGLGGKMLRRYDELNEAQKESAREVFPDKTHHCEQSAVVTIFDPVMNEIEKYIND